MQAQMLLKMNDKLDGVATDVAVIRSQMTVVPLLEERMRVAEGQLAALQGADQRGKDQTARVTSWIAAAAAAGAGIAQYLHH